MKRPISCLVVGLVTVGFACSKSETSSESPTKPAEPALATPSEVSTAQTPKAAAAASTAAEVSSFSLELVGADKLKQAAAQNTAALQKQRSGDLSGAIELYQQALEADPGHVFARYNLASAHSLKGNNAEALALLSQLASQSGCSVCQGRLVRAKQDKDFALLHNDESFKALTSGATVETITAKQAMMRTIKKLLADNTLPTELIHPRNPIEVNNTNGNCDGDDCTSKVTIIGLDQAERTFGETFPVEMKVGACSKDCCKAEATGQVGDNSMAISELCVSTDSGGVTTIRSIAIREG